FRAGLFNIGAEGQEIVGWLVAGWVGLVVEAPIYIYLHLAFLAAAVDGGFYGFISGVLKAKLVVHEVILTFMLNYIALYSANSIIRNVLTDRADKTDKISPTASLTSDWLQSFTDYSRLHYGIIIALIMALMMWYIMEKTTLGYEIKAVGFNPHASRY